MKLKQIAVLCITIVAAFSLTTTTWAVAEQANGTLEQNFDVSDGGMLEVDASFGSIEVSTSSNSRVEVRVVREVRDNYEDDAAQILAEHEVQIDPGAEAAPGV